MHITLTLLSSSCIDPRFLGQTSKAELPTSHVVMHFRGDWVLLLHWARIVMKGVIIRVIFGNSDESFAEVQMVLICSWVGAFTIVSGTLFPFSHLPAELLILQFPPSPHLRIGLSFQSTPVCL